MYEEAREGREGEPCPNKKFWTTLNYFQIPSRSEIGLSSKGRVMRREGMLRRKGSVVRESRKRHDKVTVADVENKV